MEGAMNRMMLGVADFALGLASEDVLEAAPHRPTICTRMKGTIW